MERPPERSQARDDPERYDVTPDQIPPAPAAGGAEDGGEAAASRRLAGDPVGETTRRSPDAPEPVLGYDAMDSDDVLRWLDEADPDVDVLRRIRDYERSGLARETVLRECEKRVRRLEGR